MENIADKYVSEEDINPVEKNVAQRVKSIFEQFGYLISYH